VNYRPTYVAALDPAGQVLYRRFKECWLTRFGNNGLSPVIDNVFPLADASKAHQRMEETV
jgi:hypothetical protein